VTEEVQPVTIAPLRLDFAVTGVIAEPFEGARSLGDWGYGLMLLGGVHWKDFPVSFGFDAVGIRWGQSKSLFDVRLGDTPVALEETRTDQTILLDSWLRLQPQTWPVRPYLEGVAGVKFLETEYSFTFPGGTGTMSTVTDQASASTIGWGAGFDVLLAHSSDGLGSAVFATFGLRRLAGSRASFTRAPDTSSASQVVSFDLPTNTTLVLFGVSIRAHRAARGETHP
jgi:hypothetical protein